MALGIGIIILVLAVFVFFLACGASAKDDDLGPVMFLAAVGLTLVSAYCLWNAGFEAGAIAHASGKFTATRIDHGDRVEWKVEAVKENP